MLLDFTPESERRVLTHDTPYKVDDGPVRSIFRRSARVRPQKMLPWPWRGDKSSGGPDFEDLDVQLEGRFRVEDRFILYKNARRIDIGIGITNAGKTQQTIPDGLRILDGEMGKLLMRGLGKVDVIEKQEAILWLNGSTGYSLAYIPHGPKGPQGGGHPPRHITYKDAVGWERTTIGVDQFRFAPSRGPGFRLSGVREELDPGESKRFRFSILFDKGAPAETRRQFQKDVHEVPGPVSIHGLGDRTLRVASTPRYIANGMQSRARWIPDDGVTLYPKEEGILIRSDNMKAGAKTGFSRDFRQPTELWGKTAEASDPLQIGIQSLGSNEIHWLGPTSGLFRFDLNKQLPFDRFTKCLLHLRPVRRKKASQGTRTVHVESLSLNRPMPAPPKLPWPRNGQSVSDVGVSFSIRSVDGSERGYQFQMSRDKSFNEPVIDETFPCDTGLKGEGGLTKYLPSKPPAKGKYFWRVRPMNWSGQPGRWSKVKYFIVDSTDRAKADPVREISPQRPVLFGGTHGQEERAALAKKAAKHYPVVRDLIIEQRGYEAGGEYPLKCFIGTSSKPTLPMLEQAYRNEPQVVGMIFREFGFDPEYLRRVLALSAKYGRYVSALSVGGDLMQRTALSKRYYSLMKEYARYMVPEQKLHQRQEPFARMLVEIGAYLTGQVGNWGVETEWDIGWKTMSLRRWRRVEAVNRPISYMYPFVFGLATGATHYRLESLDKYQIPRPFDHRFDDPFGPLWKRAIAPFFHDIKKHDMIPTRREMLEKVKLGVAGRRKHGLKRPNSPGGFFPNRVVGALHGLPIDLDGVPRQRIFENTWTPDWSRFYVVPSYLPKADRQHFEAVIDAGRFAYPEDVVDYAGRYYPAPFPNNEAFSVLVGDTGVVLNSLDERRDPLSGPQAFRLKLTKGPVSQVKGKIDFQAYLLMKQRADSLFIHAPRISKPAKWLSMTVLPE